MKTDYDAVIEKMEKEVAVSIQYDTIPSHLKENPEKAIAEAETRVKETCQQIINYVNQPKPMTRGQLAIAIQLLASLPVRREEYMYAHVYYNFINKKAA